MFDFYKKTTSMKCNGQLTIAGTGRALRHSISLRRYPSEIYFQMCDMGNLILVRMLKYDM